MTVLLLTPGSVDGPLIRYIVLRYLQPTRTSSASLMFLRCGQFLASAQQSPPCWSLGWPRSALRRRPDRDTERVIMRAPLTRPWTDEDILTLATLLGSGRSVPFIARRLRR